MKKRLGYENGKNVVGSCFDYRCAKNQETQEKFLREKFPAYKSLKKLLKINNEEKYNFMINILNQKVHLSGYYFVTGTDTEIGKTTVTSELIKSLAAQEQACYAIKPVTAGVAIDSSGHAYSDDAQRINQFATVKPPISAIAPILLTTPSSPHIAAAIDGVSLSAQAISEQIRQTLQDYPADTVLIEGAGGWFTPINEQESLADVAIQLNFPVIVVIGIKLGSLNHAVLTVQAIQQAGLSISAVIFNQIAPHSDFYTEQTAWLEKYLSRHYFSHQLDLPLFLHHAFAK